MGRFNNQVSVSGGDGSVYRVYNKELNGQPAIFTSTANRDTYFTDNADEFTGINNQPLAVGIGPVAEDPSENNVTQWFAVINGVWEDIVGTLVGASGMGTLDQSIPDGSLLMARMVNGVKVPVASSMMETPETVGTPKTVRSGLRTRIEGAYDIISTGRTLSVMNIPTGEIFRLLVAGNTNTPTVLVDRAVQEFDFQLSDSVNLTNPSFTVTIAPLDTDNPENGQYVQGVTLRLDNSSVTTNITFVLMLAGVVFQRYFFASVTPDASNNNEFYFEYEPPIDVLIGDEFEVSITSTDGDVILKGDGVSGIPYQRPMVALTDFMTIASTDQIRTDAQLFTLLNSFIVAGANITKTVNEEDGTISISSSSGGVSFPIPATNVSFDDSGATGILANVDEVQEALQRLDSTGIGAAPRTFTGSFFSSFGELGNQDQWYGGRQTVEMLGARGQPNGRYTYQVPDPTELGLMFDDMVSRGLPEVYTLIVSYQGGSSTSVVRNALTVTRPSVSIGGFVQTTLAQGTSVTYRIERVGGTINNWERLGVQQSGDPIATFGEVVLQNTGWNNANNSFLPTGDIVQKGYAFPVIGSNPNDGTLRQGLIDSGVSDRVIYDGDYIVWTADTFTSWTNGNDWFVLDRNSLQRMSREQSNFLAQSREVDNRVDIGFVQMMTGDALVWLSENPFAEPPFLTPSGDTQNPRPGDNYPYIGGRQNRNVQQLFQSGRNWFNSYITLGITPNFIAAHPENTIDIVVMDTDGTQIERLNLANDFTFRNDGDFTNATVRHYTRSSTFNYPSLAIVAIVLTQVQEHFTLNPNTVNLTPNVSNIVESQLSSGVIEKLNQTPESVNIVNPIDPYLTRTITISHNSDYGEAYFLSTGTTDTYPTQLSDFSQVSQSNPRFTTSDVVLFVAVAEPDTYALLNTTQDTIAPLDNSSPNISVIESFTDNNVTYFVFMITSVTSGDRYEVQRVTVETLLALENNINEIQSDLLALENQAGRIPEKVRGILENDISVTEEVSPNLVPSSFNNSLGSGGTQKVYIEGSPNTPSSGVLNSNVLSVAPTSRERQKLVYIGRDHVYQNADLLTGFDGVSNTRVLATYMQNAIFAKQFVPAVPAGTATSVIYPAPSNLISGQGVWQTIEALTFRDDVPVPEADELFFTRNIPTSSQTLTIQYRGHANGNVFGAGTTTLNGVGGSSEVATSVTISDGSETATLEIRYYPNRNGNREIRATVTERVNVGLPTINDVQVILSWEETRTVPATNARTRDVEIERVATSGTSNVIAVKPSSTGTIILVGSEREVDTGFLFTDVFGASLSGHLTVFSDEAVFYDFQDIEPTNNTIILLEQNSSNANFNLFNTNYTHETVLSFDTTISVPRFNINDIPTSSTGLSSGDVWNDSGVLKIVT